ncbi:potassium/proton antiporter [Rapidithrix thailandica]|uniref:Potassium/proton antiporter n=1 Tax=Rapidithrix thailandica TaxID=413964 RepID=A0AAW9S458_9BACT
MTYYYILLIAAILLLISTVTSKIAAKLGFSSLLLTLGIGVFLGNGGQYDFDYNYPAATLRLSELALAFIIFTGGFNTQWKYFKSIVGQGVTLATLGVLLTAGTTAALVYFLLGWSFWQALLLGAIISSTDAAAVFSILESTGLKLKHRIGEVLELESGTNDPMAYFLTLGIATLMGASDKTVWSLLPQFFINMIIGLASGYLVGKVMHWLVVKVKLKRGQNPVILISTVLALYAVNQILGGSSFLAVYVAGIVMGNNPWENRDYNRNFFDGFSWMMETSLFLMLGLQVYLFQIPEVLWEGLIIALFLILIARPVGTLISYVFFKKQSWQKQLFVSWVGLRGATPIVFALIPVVHQLPGAERLFNISFIVVVASVLLQGNTVALMARWLGVEQVEEAS